jgi:hypothetical protein
MHQQTHATYPRSKDEKWRMLDPLNSGAETATRWARAGVEERAICDENYSCCRAT